MMSFKKSAQASDGPMMAQSCLFFCFVLFFSFFFLVSGSCQTATVMWQQYELPFGVNIAEFPFFSFFASVSGFFQKLV